jgi:restriction system protein
VRRLARSGIAAIDRMDGETFEFYLSTLFKRLGCEVKRTARGGDFGADLILTSGGRRPQFRPSGGGGRSGVKAVQEAVASKGMYGCAQALVVTSIRFTEQARKLAGANGVELMDRDGLVRAFLRAQGAKATAVERSASCLPVGCQEASNSPVRSCAVCSVQVSPKVLAYCLDRPETIRRQALLLPAPAHPRRNAADDLGSIGGLAQHSSSGIVCDEQQ